MNGTVKINVISFIIFLCAINHHHIHPSEASIDWPTIDMSVDISSSESHHNPQFDFQQLNSEISKAKKEFLNLKEEGKIQAALFHAASYGLLEETRSIIQTGGVNIFESNSKGVIILDQLLKAAQIRKTKLKSHSFRTLNKASQDSFKGWHTNATSLVNYLNYLKRSPQLKQTIGETLQRHLPPTIIALICSYTENPDDFAEPESGGCLVQ